MVRQRCTAISAAAIAAALLFLASGAAFAQQIYINSIWVSRAENCVAGTGPLQGRYYCPSPANTTPLPACPTNGNISNDPHIEFDQFLQPGVCQTGSIPPGSLMENYCNSQLMLCANIGYNNNQSGATPIAIDQLSFEIFKYSMAANPLNPESTPPVRTFSIDAPGTVPDNTAPNTGVGIIPDGTSGPSPCPNINNLGNGCGYCILWDGGINIAGELGKSNGQYGFRAHVQTNQTGINGNITIDQTRAYPSGTTLDRTCNASGGTVLYNGVNVNLPGTVLQQPITMDVVDIHNVRSTPTVVGTFSGVLAEPYAVTYRLAKDAMTSITITRKDDATPAPPGIPDSQMGRILVNNLPRVGEGVPDGTLQNGDAWNGRADNGDLDPPGDYLITINAQATDNFGLDAAAPVTRQISLDPLQITDILVQPLTSQATSLAVLTYTLTEPAEVYLDIFSPGTQFTRGLNNVNDPALDGPGGATAVSKDFGATGTLVRRYVQQQDFRKPVVSFWDGRDFAGNVLPDGDYVFVLYGSLPSQNGYNYTGSGGGMRIWSSTAKTGFLTIARGLVTISQVTPATTVVGSSPAVAGLNPFIFSYSLSRDANVTMKILDPTGTNVIRTLVNHEPRSANFLNREVWNDGMNDQGTIVSSGPYLVQLEAEDPFFPSKVSTTTALFQVDLFRITDVFSTPLQSNSTDAVQLSYQLSQTMQVAWNIYPPGTVIKNAPGNWPPCGELIPGLTRPDGSPCTDTTDSTGNEVKPMITVNGVRPGRLKITEFWDGRDLNGLYVPDGSYVFTLVAESTTTPQFWASDRVTGLITIARGQIIFPVFTITPTVPQLHNSSGTITLPPYELDYSVTRQSSMTIHILTTDPQPKVVRTIISGQVRDANLLYKEFWDARDDQGGFVNPGFYTLQAVATDLASQLASGSTVQQTIAVNPLRIYDVAISAVDPQHADADILYQVSETMKVAVKIYRPGTTFDSVGNPAPPESISLVKRIVGVRQARQLIDEHWNGDDLKLADVPDGNYMFKIVGSTDVNAIDTITGNVAPGAVLAADIPIAEVPVVRNGSQDPVATFEKNTFVYPNPVTTPQATFNIYVPLQSKVTMKLYNIAGELVYAQDFGEQPADTYLNGGAVKWAKVNAAGRLVAPGVYFALIREEETLGAKNVLQTVKKVLLP